MENIKNAIDATKEKNAIDFKKFVGAELSNRLYSAINTKKEEISKVLTANQEESSDAVESATTDTEVSEANVLAPSAPAAGGKVGIPGSDRSNSGAGEVPDPLEAGLRDEIETAFGVKGNAGAPTAKDDDISLDPNFEKEFFMKEMDYKGHKVTIKQIGLGLSKPVRVYVDGNRWEFFPGPQSAVKAAKDYVDGMSAESTEESVIVDADNTLTEKVSLDARTKLFRETKARIDQYRKMREAKLGNTEQKPKVDVEENVLHGISENTKMLLNAINMKGGKYVMGEEELSSDQKKYRAFFNAALKKHGVNSPTDFKSDAEKKKFFNYVKSNWKN